MPKKGYENYKNAKTFTLFSKPALCVYFEGAILDLNYTGYPDFLYFNKMNDYACREVITGRIFYLTEDNNFYNEETGLYFSTVRFDEASTDEYKAIINDEKYIEDTFNFFNSYKEFKKEDNQKRDKVEFLLLKKGVTFRK